MLKYDHIDTSVQCSRFDTKDGLTEYYVTITSNNPGPFARDLEQLEAGYRQALGKYGLSAKTQVGTRFFLSDIANQKHALLDSSLYALVSGGVVSIIEQAPGNMISLLSCHIKGDESLPDKEKTYL